MHDYLAMWKNYANFAGKTTRGEYVFALLLHLLITCLLIFAVFQSQSAVLNTFASIYSFAICVPTLSLHIRRLRDAGMSWLWVFALLVPLFGVLVMVLLICKESA